MIAVISMVRDEADILELWINHYLAEGVDHFFIAEHLSTDSSRAILDKLAAETGRITVIANTDTHFHQVRWMNHLAAMAGAAGADFVIPADCDEFFYSIDGRTLAETLEDLPDDVQVLGARMFRHHTWAQCEIAPKPWAKVAFRWNPEAVLGIGNHTISIPGMVMGIIDLREWQYRSLAHFLSKSKTSSDTIPPEARAEGAAAHHTYMDNMTVEEKEREWNQLMAIPTRVDPIPSKHLHGRGQVGPDL